MSVPSPSTGTPPPAPPHVGLGRFLSGTRYPVQAVWYIVTHPGVWPFCMAPLVINIIIAVVVWNLSGGWTEEISSTYQDATSWWARALHWGAEAVALLLRLVMVAISIIVVGNIACVPFNDVLSEKVDKVVTGWRSDEPFRLGPEIRRQLLILGQEIKRMAIYFALMAFLFLFSLFAIFAPFVLPLQWALTMGYLAIDHLSYPLERRGAVLLKQKYGYLRTNLAPCMGFGLVMLLVALIPLINFVFIPLGVVGGTLLFADLQRGHLAESATPSELDAASAPEQGQA